MTPYLPDGSSRWRLRPAREADLDGLDTLAQASAIGITSLPAERGVLAAGLARSCEAFAAMASGDDASGEERYLFVLEDRADGRLAGTAGITAAAGFNDRFYSYRNEFIVQVSPALQARNRIHTLHLCHDLTGVTLLTGFHVDPALAASAAPQLLSRARLAFIAAHAERFSDRIAAENPGLADDTGRCPFWAAVGERFFGVTYPEAERVTAGKSPKDWIAELMPQSPIYVPLLPDEAQWALGQLHPVGELPFSILIDEGLDGDSYVNLFDGGPTAEGRLEALKTVRRRRRAGLGALRGAPADGALALVDNGGGADFCALLAPAGGVLALAAADVQALGTGPQWAAPLDPWGGEDRA